jgi:hypothetical protein
VTSRSANTRNRSTPIFLGPEKMGGWAQIHGLRNTYSCIFCIWLSGTDRVHTKVQDFLVKFGELLPTIFVSTLWAFCEREIHVSRDGFAPPPLAPPHISQPTSLLLRRLFEVSSLASRAILCAEQITVLAQAVFPVMTSWILWLMNGSVTILTRHLYHLLRSALWVVLLG